MKRIIPVMRRCISCRSAFNRADLLKITRDHNNGIVFKKGMGRSAYICKKKQCLNDAKIKKKLQKALKVSFDQNFYDNFKKEIQNYN